MANKVNHAYENKFCGHSRIRFLQDDPCQISVLNYSKLSFFLFDTILF